MSWEVLRVQKVVLLDFCGGSLGLALRPPGRIIKWRDSCRCDVISEITFLILDVVHVPSRSEKGLTALQ